MVVLLPLTVLLAAACGGEADTSGAAQDGGGAESCYEGETVTFLVPYAPGGGYDLMARTLGPALEEQLGATVVVENAPGAGGLTAANTLYTAEPDGLTMAVFPGTGIIGAALAEPQGASFDALDFTYVARLGPDLRVMTVGAQSALETTEDLRSADVVRFASSGPGGPSHMDPIVISHVLDFDAEMVTGFSGSPELALAVTSGDVDATVASVGSRLEAIENGDHRPLLIAAGERAEELPDVPALTELDLDDDKRAVAEAHADLAAAGRAILAPPGVPEDCRSELEAAFEVALSDPEVLDPLEQANETIAFMSGQELEEIFRSVIEDSPEEYVSLLKDSYAGQ